MSTQVVSCRLPSRLVDELEAMSKRVHVSKTSLMTTFLDDGLAKANGRPRMPKPPVLMGGPRVELKMVMLSPRDIVVINQIRDLRGWEGADETTVFRSLLTEALLRAKIADLTQELKELVEKD